MAKMICGIYQIYNCVNGRQYIGSARNISKRLAEHRRDLIGDRHVNRYLQHAWSKYGESNFSFYLVEECGILELLKKEQWYLDNTLNLYNLAANVASPWLGRKHSEDTKNRLREMSRGNSNAKGHHHTEETRRRISEAAKSAIHRSGWNHTEETKRKIGQANRRKSVLCSIIKRKKFIAAIIEFRK